MTSRRRRAISLGLICTFAAAFGAYWPPWPLRVFQNDVILEVLHSTWILHLARFAITLVLLLSFLSFGSLLARRFKRSWPGHVLALSLLLAALASYLPIKNALVAELWQNRLSRDRAALVLVNRSAYFPEGERILVSIVTPQPEIVKYLPSSSWPYNFISDDSELIQVPDEKMTEIVAALCETRFFALPEELSPGPALRPEGLYVALSSDSGVRRVFGRAGEPGYDSLRQSVEAVQGRLPEGSSGWW